MWFLALAVKAAKMNTSSWLLDRPQSWLLDRPESLAARFFDAGTGVWPACFGALILCAGFFGLVGLGDLDGSDWLYYSLEGGVGSYLLKRTFTLA